MDRAGLIRALLFGGAGLLLFFLLGDVFGTKSGSHQPLAFESNSFPAERAVPTPCDIWSPEFHATLGTNGGSVQHFRLLKAKYRRSGKPEDLSTTPDLELRQQLRFQWRNEGAAGGVPWQIAFDSFDWRLARSDGKSCTFAYEDPDVSLEKTVRATGRPYELEAVAVVKNLAKDIRRHALAVETTDWRATSETQAGMFRVSPFLTHVECVPKEGKAVRLMPTDFEPDDFKAPEFSKTNLNPGDWHQAAGPPAFAAVANAYFAHAIVPLDRDPLPVCQLQIEERWDASRYKRHQDDPSSGAMYRARLAYPPRDLAPGESATYSVLTYVGPKEREVLQGAGDGKHRLSDLIDLGFFASIAKVLVAFLLRVHGVIPNWGVAIVVLTITARLLLFPLSLPGIKNMIKMREVKPEMDALNERYKDDPQAKGIAQMELWKKHGVNPFKGCLPQMASLPVWFALYTTLQTAVELYNIPFLWFPDLSRPDPFFVLPFVIGITYFVQQKIMPMQGDPVQQKMMMYFMPGMFVVFMLFLPAGLGVYMFTNSVLGISQQQLVEWHARRSVQAATSKT